MGRTNSIKYSVALSGDYAETDNEQPINIFVIHY